MKKEPEDLIQATYTAAQLVADDLDEAARLVERVFAASAPSTSDEAMGRLSTLAAGMNARRAGLLADRMQREQLDQVVQRALVVLPAERRLAVYRAFLQSESDPGEPENPERMIFLYAVQRGMDTAARGAITAELVSDALNRTITVTAENVPPELRDAIVAHVNAASLDGKVIPVAASRRAAVRFATAVTVIVVASFLGMWLGRPASVPDAPGQEGEDLLVRLEERVQEGGTPIFSGGSTEQAEAMLEERFSMRAAVPRMDGGSLQQLWSTQISRIDLPALTYLDADAEQVHLFILSYSLLNANRRVLPFPADVLNQIAVPDGVDIRTGDAWNRVIWRHRDDIYIAYTQGDALSLRPQLTY